MGLAAKIMGAGFSAGQARGLIGGVAPTVSAAGTTQGTATSISAGINFVSTAAANSGVILPSCDVGDSLIVYNGGANQCIVYPDSGSSINGVATNSGTYLPIQTSIIFFRVTSTKWIGNLSA